MVALGLILISLAGIAEAVMDTLQFHYSRSIFDAGRWRRFWCIKWKYRSWWNPEESWKFKYKNNDSTQGAKFPGSTTIFVGLTDGWHCFKLIRNLFLFGGILCLALPNTLSVFETIICIASARTLYGITFSVFYTWVLVEPNSSRW